MRSVILTLLILLTGCSPVTEPEHKTRAECIPAHTDQDATLRRQMQALQMVVYERSRSELERDDLRRRHLLTLSQSVGTLAESLRRSRPLPIARGETNASLATYQALVQQLARDAQALERVADAYAFEHLDITLGAMQHTCDTCHETFRDCP